MEVSPYWRLFSNQIWKIAESLNILRSASNFRRKNCIAHPQHCPKYFFHNFLKLFMLLRPKYTRVNLMYNLFFKTYFWQWNRHFDIHFIVKSSSLDMATWEYRYCRHEKFRKNWVWISRIRLSIGSRIWIQGTNWKWINATRYTDCKAFRNGDLVTKLGNCYYVLSCLT